LKQVDICAKVRGNLKAVVWRSPREGNFCDKQEAQKPITVTDYNRHMSYANKGDRMANGYSLRDKKVISPRLGPNYTE
jgi:hypothetical protein